MLKYPYICNSNNCATGKTMKPKLSNKSRSNINEKVTTFKVVETVQLMAFLTEKMPEKSRTAIKSLLANKQVKVDGKVITHFSFEVPANSEIAISSVKAPKEVTIKGLRIVYEDLDLIVIHKDQGLLSVSTNKENEKTAYSLLSNYVKQADAKNQIYIVHRLDRETSGVMMFCKTFEVKKFLQTDWQETVMDRCYYVVVEGKVEADCGTVHSWLTENKNFQVFSSPIPNGGQEAVTHYKVLKRSKNFSLLEVRLETGRKNQIRVHMQDLGHSVIGDKKYGATSNPINRLGLHAFLLAFKHPSTKEVMKFLTPIPPEFDGLFKNAQIVEKNILEVQ